MILNRSHHFIFVHVPKTAGISIEHVFLDLMGLTWDTRADVDPEPLQQRPVRHDVRVAADR